MARLAPLVAALALVAARPAEACQCLPVRELLSPAPGTDDAPLNAVVVIDTNTGVTVEVREVATSAPVPIDVESRALTLVRPTTSWAPLTEYEVILDDTYSLGTFRTTAETDDTPPAPIELERLTAWTMPYPVSDCSSFCVTTHDDHVDFVEFAHTATAGMVWMDLEVTTADAPAPFYVGSLKPHAGTRTLDWGLCGTVPRLQPDSVVCARLRAFDAAGNASAHSAEICTAVPSCAPLEHPVEDCQPAAECRLEPPSGGGACALGSPARRRAGAGAGAAAIGALALALRLSRPRGRRASSP